ncbi:chaplin [Streptomyces sp. NPDC006285]|uniref:chaplin n=1 Tax=Streptomyces sp. NPDC006285 TaxID=3364742 RepID=UPI003680E7B9
MKRVARNGLILAAAASGAVGLATPAHADSAADGATAHSPGAISGNTIQLPVHVPVNACGNTVNVVGLLNPAMGNSCANEGGKGGGEDGGYGGGGHQGSAGAVADGSEKDSPGLISGNGVHLPVQLPVNVTGNAVSVVGIGNPSVGNESSNTSGDRPHRPSEPAEPSVPKPAPPSKQPVKPADPVEHETPRTLPQDVPGTSLAHTGAGPTGPTVAASAALLLGGALLYRRFRPAAVQRSERGSGTGR